MLKGLPGLKGLLALKEHKGLLGLKGLLEPKDSKEKMVISEALLFIINLVQLQLKPILHLTIYN